MTPSVGEAIPVGEPVALAEAVPVGEAAQVGKAVPVAKAVPVGEAAQLSDPVALAEAVPVGVETVTEGVGEGIVTEGVGEGRVTEGVGEGIVTEGVGEGVVAASPWIDGRDDCPTTATTSLGPSSCGRPADCDLNTADLCGYSLRGTCESARTEMKRATFRGAGLGKSDRVRVRTAVMAAARAPTVRMVLVTRFHHRGGGGLTG